MIWIYSDLFGIYPKLIRQLRQNRKPWRKTIPTLLNHRYKALSTMATLSYRQIYFLNYESYYQSFMNHTNESYQRKQSIPGLLCHMRLRPATTAEIYMYEYESLWVIYYESYFANDVLHKTKIVKHAYNHWKENNNWKYTKCKWRYILSLSTQNK